MKRITYRIMENEIQDIIEDIIEVMTGTAMESSVPEPIANNQNEVPPKSFTMFPQLPKELRDRIWELYFEAAVLPSIHVIHDGLATPNWQRSVLWSHPRRIPQSTTLEPGTSIHLRRPITPLINKESRDMAKLRKFVPSRTIRLTQPINRDIRPPGLPREVRALKPPHASAAVNWNIDLVYLAGSTWHVINRPLVAAWWVPFVRRLAIASTACTTAPDYMGTFKAIGIDNLRESLDPNFRQILISNLKRLRELYVVFVPHAPVMVAAAATPAAKALKRDAFGFVEYNEFIHVAGPAVIGCPDAWKYLRLVGRLRQCIDSPDEKGSLSIELKRVVDIDRCLAPEGEYRRKEFPLRTLPTLPPLP